MLKTDDIKAADQEAMTRTVKEMATSVEECGRP
jgi:hypothetical protein